MNKRIFTSRERFGFRFGFYTGDLAVRPVISLISQSQPNFDI